jgi:hypothetical protein
MNMTIAQTVKTTKLSDGTSKEDISTVVGTVITGSRTQFQVACDPRQSMSSSCMTVEANGVRVETRHHATCKELSLDTREVSVEHIKTGSETSVYLIAVL